MHLLVRNHVARTHRAAILPSTLADPNTTLQRPRKAEVVVRKAEVGFRLGRMVIGPIAEILVDAVWPHDFARIHFPVWVPDIFEFLKSTDQLLPEHARQQFGAGLPVAMLARQRAAVADDEVSRFLDE